MLLLLQCSFMKFEIPVMIMTLFLALMKSINSKLDIFVLNMELKSDP